MARLGRLNDDVINQIKSHLCLNTIDSIIEHLLKDSLQRNPKNIIVKVYLDSLSIHLQDDGDGYTFKELEKLLSCASKPDPFATKAYSSSLIGYIGAVSQFSIVSKYKTAQNIFKMESDFQDGSVTIYNTDNLQMQVQMLMLMLMLMLTLPYKQFCEIETVTHGSVYRVENIFYNFPVRRKQIQAMAVHKIVNSIKLVFLKLLLFNLGVHLEFSIKDSHAPQFEQVFKLTSIHDDYGQTLLQSLFGLQITWQNIKARYKSFEITGIIGLEPVNSKTHQYIFVNNKLMAQSRKISAQLNEIFIKSGFGFNNISTSNNNVTTNSITKSTGKLIRKFPCFLIQVKSNDLAEIKEDSHSWMFIVDIIGKIFKTFVNANEKTNEGQIESEYLKLLPSPEKIHDKSREKNLTRSNQMNRIFKGRHFQPQGLTLILTMIQPLLCSPNYLTVGHNYNYNYNYNPDYNEDEINFGRLHLAPNNYRIIRQIDNKFILLMLFNNPLQLHLQLQQSPTPPPTPTTPQLVVLDQHASDERIKIEKLIKEFVDEMSANPGLRLCQPLIIDLHPHELQYLHQYASNFQLFGIEYIIIDQIKLAVTKLPKVLITKVGNDTKFMKDMLLQHSFDVNNKVKNQYFNIKDEDWFAISHNIPRAIIDLLNSKACRSAIMFGDPLTYTEMSSLIQELSQCKLPFQCAHGRPSVVPLARFVLK